MSDSDNLLDPSGHPRRFGDYMIHGLLGEGGMARVYAGEELLSGRRVALKVLRSEFAQSEKGRRQFMTEMAILANLDDPYIVRCLSCVEIERQPVMVLEVLNGWNLRQMLEQRVALGWREAATIAHQIAQALRTAHSQRQPIVHRDLKPENVMCMQEGIKVMDFGIAKILQTLAGPTTHPFGTPRYMSPEQIDAQPVDGRADLFALGVILWEMLSGRPPFASDSPRVLLEQICVNPTPALPDHVRRELPTELESLIHRLLAKRPSDRPTSAAEVVAALEPFAFKPTIARERPRQATAPATPRLDTSDIVHGFAHTPIRDRVDKEADEAIAMLHDVGRATSAWIVRVLISVMILPAAAVLFLAIPATLAIVDLLLLANEGIATGTVEEFGERWLGPLSLVVVACSFVFLRTTWRHRRAPSTDVSRDHGTPWWMLGAIVAIVWLVLTILEFQTKSDLDGKVHAASIAGFGSWLGLTGSWVAGRFASFLLARFEAARNPQHM